MASSSVEVVVLGAGVVGIAIARALAIKGKEVLLVEKQSHFGEGISSRNSEVVHAGLYYPKNSYKAKFCVEGKQKLYRYVKERAIEFDQLGKIVVASDESQSTLLENILRRAKENGVSDCRLIAQKEMLELEPNVSGFAALFSPSTGIVDSHNLMLNLLGDVENNGGMICYNTKAIGCKGSATSQQLELQLEEVNGNDETSHFSLMCDTIINSCGLDAIDVAKMLQGSRPALFSDDQSYDIPKAYFCKGNYFSLNMKAPFQRLVYPLPSGGGLGVHFTLDLAGRGKFGPDTHWEENPNFEVSNDPALQSHFETSIRTYWPNLPPDSISKDYAGIRPKIAGPGVETDFTFLGPKYHNGKNIISLIGIESPGLTSSLSIADHVWKSMQNENMI